MKDERIHLPSMEEVVSPRSVAIVGVSGSGKIGFAEMILMAHMEMKTPHLYPVNPKYKDIFGVPAYPSLLDIPEPVDHVIVNIPATQSLDLLDQCAEKGVKSVQFFTAGFGESGISDRMDLEKQMLEKARKGGFRIIGPNCVGLFVPKAKTSFVLGAPNDHGPIGFLSQSGGNAFNLPYFSALRGLRFSKVVSYGNALDVDEVELLDYMADDPETEIIGAYIEGLKDGKAFFQALKAAAAKKPVVVYKGGKTQAGLRAAHGHTASMISSVEIFEAVCKQANAIQVDNMEEMQDVMVALRFLDRIPGGKRTILLGSGGGPSVLAGDEMEMAGLKIPGFSEEVQARLKTVFPVDGGIFGNPLDTVNLAQPEAIAIAFEELKNLPDYDLIVFHLGFHPIGGWGYGRFSSPEYLEQLKATLSIVRSKTDKAILIALRPPQDLVPMQEFLAVQKLIVELGFPVYHALDRLALAMSRLVDWQNRFNL